MVNWTQPLTLWNSECQEFAFKSGINIHELQRSDRVEQLGFNGTDELL